MINSSLWDEIAKASMLVKQWMVLGDFNQFGAIADTYCGKPAPSPEGSDLLRELTGGVKSASCHLRRPGSSSLSRTDRLATLCRSVMPPGCE